MRNVGLRHQYLVRILSVGFSLVILLLAAAAGLSVYRAQTIHSNSVELVNQQISAWGLANNLMVVQQRIGKEMYYLRSLNPSDAARIRSEMDAAEAEFQNMEALAGPDEVKGLRPLLQVSRNFAREVRAATETDSVSLEKLAQLHGFREEFSRLAVEAVKREADRAGRLQDAIQQESARLHSESLYLLGACLVLAMGCALLTVRASYQFLRQLQWQADELHRVSWHMLESQETTARRFSHEMHDELGQSLAGLRAILVGVKLEDFGHRRKECVSLLDETIQNVRELSQLLRPVILDDFGLDAGLRWLSDRFMSHTRVEVEYRSNLNQRMADDLETQYFRIAQEALTNVARHSEATQVYIAIEVRQNKLHLTIEDNGKGMPPDPELAQTSLGLVGMRARARQAGGELSVTKSASGGVKLEVWAPARTIETATPHEDPHFVG